MLACPAGPALLTAALAPGWLRAGACAACLATRRYSAGQMTLGGACGCLHACRQSRQQQLVPAAAGWSMREFHSKQPTASCRLVQASGWLRQPASNHGGCRLVRPHAPGRCVWGGSLPSGRERWPGCKAGRAALPGLLQHSKHAQPVVHHSHTMKTSSSSARLQGLDMCMPCNASKCRRGGAAGQPRPGGSDQFGASLHQRAAPGALGPGVRHR